MVGIDDLATDAEGNLYIAEHDNFRVRKVTPDGILTNYAVGGGDFKPSRMAFGPDGSMYITAGYGESVVATHKVWRRDPDGMLAPIAGGGLSTADGTPAGAAYIYNPTGVAVPLDCPLN